VAETSFEYRLERLFAEAPTLADAEAFAQRVVARLDREWAARRLVIGSMGALGGLIGGYEILHAGALGQLSALIQRATVLVMEAAPVPPNLPPLGVGGVAAAMTLVAAAAALGLSRLLRDA
jgi:hypothetical protein